MALRGLLLSQGGPQRTCVGCRVIDAQAALVRIASSDGRLAVGRALPGRGVYLHPRTACIAAAAKGGGFARSLRRAVPLNDVQRIVAELSPSADNLGTANPS